MGFFDFVSDVVKDTLKNAAEGRNNPNVNEKYERYSRCSISELEYQFDNCNNNGDDHGIRAIKNVLLDKFSKVNGNVRATIGLLQQFRMEPWNDINLRGLIDQRVFKNFSALEVIEIIDNYYSCEDLHDCMFHLMVGKIKNGQVSDEIINKLANPGIFGISDKVFVLYEINNADESSKKRLKQANLSLLELQKIKDNGIEGEKHICKHEGQLIRSVDWAIKLLS